MMSKESGARFPGIDFLRTFAILCVILNHSTEQLYQFKEDSFALLSSQTQVFAFIAFTLGRTGVPCFLTITGYLLMDRVYSPAQARRFWKNQWFHLLVCTWIWFSVYDLILAFSGNPITPLVYLQHLIFVKLPTYYGHVWYMPAILGLYLLIPVLSNGLHQFEAKKLLWIFALIFCYSLVLPTVNVALQALDEKTLSTQFSSGFSGGAYGLYLLMGSMVRKGVFRSVKSWLLLVLALLSFSGTVLFQLWCYHIGYVYTVWYNFASLLVLGVCLLELASRMQHLPCCSLFATLARYSFAVYLIHNVLLKWMGPWISSLPLKMPIQVFCAVVLAALLSYLCGFGIARIPRIGPYLLYLKAPQPASKNS